MEPPEPSFAAGPDGQVGYQVLGAGATDVIFVPPWSWNIEVMWENPQIHRFFARLASFCRVIIFDKRGTGISDPVPLGARPTIEAWTDDITVVLDAVGCERVAVITASESSYMGLLFAASHPARATGLVIVAGSACVARRDDYPHGLPPRLLDKALRWYNTRDLADLIAPSLAADIQFRRWFRRFSRLSMSPSEVEGIVESSQLWDVREVLPTVRVPTLVIHRQSDRYYLVGHGRYLAEHIHDARYVELPGNDHAFYAGDQDIILGEIRAFLTGVRGEPDVDRVLATVLFTDIVASTDRAADMGDRLWRETLDAHDALARRHVEQYRGRMIKTTGDGVLATFDGPARAIRCARAIEDEARNHLDISLRAGLHTGEIELRGADIGGIAVALAARVTDLAGAGEVLVSSTVKDLVVGSGLAFEDRGTHSLRGIPGNWRVFLALP